MLYLLSPAARTSVYIIPIQLFTKLYLTSHHKINSVLVNKTTSISGERGGDTPLPIFNASGQFLITIRFHAQKKEWKLKLVLVLFPFHFVCRAANSWTAQIKERVSLAFCLGSVPGNLK